MNVDAMLCITVCVDSLLCQVTRDALWYELGSSFPLILLLVNGNLQWAQFSKMHSLRKYELAIFDILYH